MRIKIFCTALLLFVLNAVSLYAQPNGLPCDDPEAPGCGPLDTWIIILAAVSFIFAITYLNRKQKKHYSAERANRL